MSHSSYRPWTTTTKYVCGHESSTVPVMFESTREYYPTIEHPCKDCEYASIENKLLTVQTLIHGLEIQNAKGLNELKRDPMNQYVKQGYENAKQQIKTLEEEKRTVERTRLAEWNKKWNLW